MISIPEVVINYFAVIVAAVINMAVGYAWYSPKILFGKQWLAALVKSEADLKAGMKSSTYPLMIVGALIMAYVLANVVDWASAVTFGEGMMVGFWAWLGFVVTAGSGTVLFEQKPVKLFYISMGYYLVVLLLTGGLLAAWQ